MNRPAPFSLWLRWVGANALAEMLGLGATFAIDALILARVSQHYRLDLLPGAKVRVDALVTLRPRGGLPMQAVLVP